MRVAWVGLLAAALLLGACKPQPKLSIDRAALEDGNCPGSARAKCTLLAAGDGRLVSVATVGPARTGVAPVPLRTRHIPASPAKRWASPSRRSGAAAGVRVLVSIPQQRLYAFRDGTLVGTSRVSTGMRGHATPTGSFRVLEKALTHHSNRYSNAPMPYMQRLTSYGIAIHAGRLPGYPASHGCIRLPRTFARTLFGLTDGTTVVTITRARPKSAAEALALG